MEDVMDFLSAALPWICLGLLLAIFFARSAQKEKRNKNNKTCSTVGLALGMCFGVAIGKSLGNNTGTVTSLGMLAGFVIGFAIDKKNNENESQGDK